ncbi:uncharacterized protein LOC128193735 [Vigna angularis]|uniref:uncharacterized protein LOC128193735 n=1 Tax=Phaseolus angularis TaxID=3914 RepID=UPI0022B4ADD6|nr:uncharacterized protein LOC128193735 [Vigna angularis]
MGLDDFVYDVAPYYPNLVRVFYSNLKFSDNGTMKTEVNNVKMIIKPNIFASIANLPSVGLNFKVLDSAGCAGRYGGGAAVVTLFGERKKREVGEGDYTDQFSTDQIFPTRVNLIEWVRKIAFDLGFVVVIIRSDTATGEAGRKTFILLGFERSGKYRKYKPDVQPSFSGTRKCECSFRLRGKPKGDGWVLKVMCGYHNHELAETLVGHPFAGRLNATEQSILVDMTNSQMLCTFHIAKNVRAKCKMLVDKVESVDVLMEVWQNVMDCDDQSMFSAYVHRLEYASSAWPLFFDYVNRTWIIPYKTYFVKAWMNKVMHLGNTTTNRVESTHWNLKRLLGSSMGDLCSCWDAMHNVIVLQHNKIKASFEKSLNVMSDAYKGLIYRRLVGRVSRYALGLIADEIERVNKIGIVSYESLLEFSIDREVELVQERFNKVDIGEKVNIKKKMIEIACLEMTSMVAPSHKVKTKGAQKSKVARHERSTKRDPSYFEHVDTFHSMTESSSRKTKVKSKAKEETRRTIPMLNQFHSICHPYIVDVVDVVVDGHCGYRCIAAMLGLGEEAWPVIRHDLYQELTQWRDEYAQLVGSYDRLEELRQSLIVNAKKWMTIPDIGYAIANRYNVILVQLQEVCPLPMVDIISSNHYYPQA